MMSWRDLRALSDLIGTPESLARDEVVIGTPMRMARIIHLDDDGRRINSAMRWGFVDRRAKSPLERPKHIHARAETVDVLPTFAGAFALRRGILLTRTFNVGQELPNGKVIQQTITPRDGKPVPIGVIWERWDNRNEGSLLTFVMVTTPPNALIAKVSDRMPAVITAEHWPLWIGETGASPAEAKAMLLPHEGDWDMAEQFKPAQPKHSKPASAVQPELF